MLTTLLDISEFADNPDQRCACVLLLDTSSSMKGKRIKKLNSGLQTFRKQLLEDNVAVKRVDLSILTFDSKVKTIQEFKPVKDLKIPKLTAAQHSQDQTFLGTGIIQALNKIEVRKSDYRSFGIPYYRPWLFMFTDGRSKGESRNVIKKAKQKLRLAETQKRVKIFPVGVGNDVDLAEISGITGTEALRLKKINFQELFEWLSVSLSRWSQSRFVGTDVPLPPPSWGTHK